MRPSLFFAFAVLSASLAVSACGHGGGGRSCPGDDGCPPDFVPIVIDTPDPPQDPPTNVPEVTLTPDPTDPPNPSNVVRTPAPRSPHGRRAVLSVRGRTIAVP